MDFQQLLLVMVTSGTVSVIAAKLLDVVLARGKLNLDDAAMIRKELREDVEALNKRADTLEAEVISWREKYYKEHEENLALKAENAEICAQNNDLAAKCADMQRKIERLEEQIEILLKRRL